MRRLPILAAGVVLLLGGCTIAPMIESPDVDSGVVIEEDEDFGTVEVYDVLDDGSLSPEADGVAGDVWELFQRIATVDFAAEVLVQYRVGDAPESDTLAYVSQDDDPDYWILAANLATAEDEDLMVATLIHEYVHILTLATDEFDAAGTCAPEEEMSEGCPAPDSAIADFRDRFWVDYVDAPSVDNTDEDVAWEFYQAHEEDFVSDYAATNLVEDIAESFMTYVLEESADGDSVVAHKLRFFDDYPELSAIRERIRADVGL